MEDGFIRFKQGLLKRPTQEKQESRIVPPAVLYIAVEEKVLDKALKEGIVTKDGKEIILNKTTSSALTLEGKTKVHLLKINTLEMLKEGITFNPTKKSEWCVTEIKAKYITLII